MKKRITQSVKKFIRKEKARIRRQVLDTAKQREEIKKLYENFKIEKFKN